MTASPSQTENSGIAARYAPPTFTSRDPHFERYFWTTPYGYCNNNPLKYVDPTGMDGELVGSEEDIQTALKYIQNAAPNMKLEIQENVDDIGCKAYKLVMGEGGVAKTKYENNLKKQSIVQKPGTRKAKPELFFEL